jgi:hypothetical protein
VHSLALTRLESAAESLAVPEGEEAVLKAQVDVHLFELPFVVHVRVVRPALLGMFLANQPSAQ